MLIRRTEKCRNDAHKWDIPGGALDFNEAAEDAIVREVKEELGIDIGVKRFLCCQEPLVNNISGHVARPVVLEHSQYSTYH